MLVRRVLSDPERRRAYNDQLRRAENGDVTSVGPAPPVPPGRTPVSIFEGVEPIRPPVGATYHPLRRTFSWIGVPEFEHPEGLNMEVVLRPEEARHGCVLPIRVPAFPCLACGRQGIAEHRIVRVRIPAMARTGSIFEMPLQGWGIRNFYLRLHVFVASDVTNHLP